LLNLLVDSNDGHQTVGIQSGTQMLTFRLL